MFWRLMQNHEFYVNKVTAQARVNWWYHFPLPVVLKTSMIILRCFSLLLYAIRKENSLVFQSCMNYRVRHNEWPSQYLTHFFSIFKNRKKFFFIERFLVKFSTKRRYFCSFDTWPLFWDTRYNRLLYEAQVSKIKLFRTYFLCYSSFE